MALQLDTALIKTASRCNYDCSYCYVYQGKDTSWRDQPKRMSEDVIDSLIEQLIIQANTQTAGFAIVLHGGEPLLLGLNKLTALIRGLRQKLDPERYPISLQTNGALINKEFLDLFSSEKVSVSVSIDGDQGANDIARVDIKGNSTFSKTVNGIKALRSHTDSEFLFAGTLSVIQPSLPAIKTYDFLKSLGSPNMDFLMQDGNHDRLPQGKSSFTSTEYGDWLCELFECYTSDPTPVPIRFFDDIVRLLLGDSGTKEGQGTDPYGILIFETDGEIRKNDTLRSSFDGADFFTSRWNVRNTKISDVLSSSEFAEYAHMQIPICEACKSCELQSVCGGGMPLYRWSEDHGYDAPSVYCHDHIKIIRSVKERLMLEGVECV
ncbi:cyclophane-forming radical SAM/SPASM peptide maturase YhhB [Marinospirillum insulare]|jgi:uncharacterized protein|uniref:Radical SAM core domain-containing protein n=1 Tax=Marinospirillum insulare TaxID=217169 RepID=A0ABQ5ZYP5_9GAMM|nr:cyclophane-forming radical SAM/SPASM peptide maturase YhhB [Marinospirillum insulare]GLR65104.1 hypothetical protein GCM10007878_25430 [Marinospirillum insulare]